MIVKKLELLFQPLLMKMLQTNHGDSENTNSIMKLNKNAPFSTLNVTLRVFHTNSVEDHQTSEKTVFPLLLDLLKSPPKVELPFTRITITKERRSYIPKVLNVLKTTISNSFK